MRGLLPAVSVALFLAACSSGTVTNGVPATATAMPAQASCGAPSNDVVYLEPSDLANPDSPKVQNAAKRFKSHAFVVLCGSSATELAGDLGIPGVGSTSVLQSIAVNKTTFTPPPRAFESRPTDTLPSPEPTTAATQEVAAFYLSSLDVVNEFDGFIVDKADESGALNDWIHDALNPSTFSEPVIGNGWVQAFTRTVPYEPPTCPQRRIFHFYVWTPCANLSKVTFAYYRLTDINPNFDWYMVTERLSGKPDWQGDKCKPFIHFGGWNWWSNEQRAVEIGIGGSPPGVTLYSDGPPTTESEGSVNYTIGGTLSVDLVPGVSGSYSAEWKQPHVTISNTSGGTYARQLIEFSPPGIVCSPVSTTITSASSEHSAIYQVPERAGLSVRGGTALNYYAWADHYRNQGDAEMRAFFSPAFDIASPVFTVTPRRVTVKPGGPAVKLHVTARIGPSNLRWRVDNKESWLVIDRGTGNGDGDITLEAQEGTAPGSIANLNIDTNPESGANDVERSPLIVRVETAKASPTPAPTPSPSPSPSPAPSPSPTPSPTTSPTSAPGKFYDYALSLHPLAYYRLDATSGSAMADSSGNGYTGTLVGSAKLGVPGLLSGNVDKAIALTGGYVTLPSMAAYKQFTLVTLVRAGHYALSRTLVGYYGNYLAIANGKLKWCTKVTGACSDSLSPALSDGKAYILFLTVSISSRVATVTCSTNGATLVNCNRALYGSNALFSSGNFLGHGPLFPNFAGTLDESIVYPAILTQEQITTLAKIAGY